MSFLASTTVMLNSEHPRQQSHSEQAGSINSATGSTHHRLITCQHFGGRRAIENKHLATMGA